MKTIKLVPMALIALLAFNSCSNDDDSKPVNEEEVVTTVAVSLTPEGFGLPVVMTSRDLDGDGPDAPLVTISGSLQPNTTYDGTVTLLNELSNPMEDITLEVKEEGDEHQFFYTTSGGLTGTFAYADADVNGKPIGLEFTFTTSAMAQSGNFTVILKHEPNKSAAGVASGDITNAGGETDVQMTFAVSVN